MVSRLHYNDVTRRRMEEIVHRWFSDLTAEELDEDPMGEGEDGEHGYPHVHRASGTWETVAVGESGRLLDPNEPETPASGGASSES